ncbi:methyl-coenzyme M reductase [Acinetobacter towneri]|uniref:Methyl-coenzyme M reductase n=2 Tax=Acinetobacter towneri TaxID=202956 RepID=A0ABX7THD5_9GAMM|nr:methyl-coenzyme M reductase [Acinetobacter towneri]QTD62956.1 methyl-coenzyme M reductase [Acinetobacter towneri]
MMLIPRSQGREVSRPSLQQHTPMTGLASIGNAIGGAFEARDQKQQEAEVSAKRLELYHNALDEQEAKVKLDDVMTTEMSEQVTLLKNDVSNGVMTADAASQTFKKWSDERYKQLENDMPMHARQNLKNYWDANSTKQTPGFLPLQLRADVQKGVVLADRITDIATRYERKQGREYLETSLAGLNLPEADKQARLYNYETTRDVLDIDGRISAAVEGNNIADLQTLVSDLDNGKYGYIDGPTAQQKKNMALSRIDALNKQAEVQENKRVQVAGKLFNDFKTQVMTGRALDDDYVNNVGESVKGTEHEGEYQFYKQQSLNFGRFSKLSTSEQLKLINEQKAKAKNSKSADPATEEKILGVYESIYAEKLKTGQNNPNQLVAEAGIQVNTIEPAEFKTNPKGAAQKIVDNATSQLALKDNNIKLAPISQEDLPDAKKAFDAMSVNDKLNFIGGLISESKGVQSGNAIWGATLGQLGGGDLSYIMAGVARMNNYKSTQGEDVATAIISGTQVLKNKQLIIPKDDILKQKFSEYVGNSASGNTANMSFAAFKSIYAHLTERNSYQHKDKDDFSKEIMDSALSMSTGGVYVQGNFKNTVGGKIKDWKVSKPYGMDDTLFEGHLAKGYAQIANQTGLSVSDLESLRLRRSDRRSPKGEIQYDLINERGNPLQVGGVVWRINIDGATK